MSKLLLNEPPLQVLPTLAKHVGINEAIILQQLHYWLGSVNSRLIEGTRWVYNTYQQWQRQFPWLSERTLRRMITHLEDIGLIVSANHNTHKTNQTKWYTLNYDKLALLEANTFSAFANKEESNECHLHDPTPSSFMASSGGHADPLNRSACPYVEAVSMATSYTETTEITSESAPRVRACEAMISIWNEKVCLGRPKVALTPIRSQLLEKRLMDAFNGNLEEWEAFCKRIVASDFLMARITGTRGWKATLDWALEPSNIHKILEGNFDNAVESGEITNEQYATDETSAYMDTHQHPLMNEARQELLKQIDQATYYSWLSPLTLASHTEKTVLLQAPTRFMREWVMNHYHETLLRVFQAIKPTVQKVEIIVHPFCPHRGAEAHTHHEQTHTLPSAADAIDDCSATRAECNEASKLIYLPLPQTVDDG